MAGPSHGPGPPPSYELKAEDEDAWEPRAPGRGYTGDRAQVGAGCRRNLICALDVHRLTTGGSHAYQGVAQLSRCS